MRFQELSVAANIGFCVVEDQRETGARTPVRLVKIQTDEDIEDIQDKDSGGLAVNHMGRAIVRVDDG